MNASHCVFCRIIAGELPAWKVMETPDLLAFLDIQPVHPGHVLIVPKHHAEQLTDLTHAQLLSIIEAAQQVMCAQKEVLSCEGVNLLQNNGAAAGQVVPHVHLHLIPRWSTDGLKHWPGSSLDAAQGARLADQFSAAIR